MSREKQIKLSADNFIKKRMNNRKFDYIMRGAYIAGAQWAYETNPLKAENDRYWEALEAIGSGMACSACSCRCHDLANKALKDTEGE